MSATLDLYIDTATGELIQGGASVGGSLPTLTRNDSYTLRLRLLEKQPNGLYNDIDLTGASLKAGIGEIEDPPSAGAFKLTCNGVTSDAIDYNASALAVYNAISNNVATVSLYGGEASAYLLTATQSNTAMSFSADTFTLFPSSTILIGTRRNPATAIAAQQTIRLIKNPIVYADSFVNSPTSNAITLSKIQDGSSTQNETYQLTIGPEVLGGSYALVFGTNATTGIPPGASAVSVQTAISSGINTITSNCSVQEDSKGGYIISFTGRLGLTNVTTNLTLDASGIDFIPFKQTTLTLSTAELEDAFSEAGTDTISPTIEIELTQNGTPKTIYQGEVTIRKDLITVGSSVPGPQASYYTKTEADAIFASRIGDVAFYGTTPISQPANTNVVSALVDLGLIATTVTLGISTNVVTDFASGVYVSTRTLRDASAVSSVNWQDRGLLNSSGTTALFWNGSAVSVNTTLVITDNNSISFGTTTGTKIGTATSQKIGFFNATPVVQPSNTNIVSALVNLGLAASSVTLGIPSNVVTDWSGNISATTRTLFDSSTTASVDWQNRVLKSSSGATALNWQTQEFGTGASVITIGANNVSITSSYYIEMGSTNGAFRTLSTTASLNFGTIAGGDYNELTVGIANATETNPVIWGVPTTVATGLVFDARVSTAGVVALRCFNVDNKNHTASTATYRITVLNYA